jgi:hypothetical protein
MRKLPPRLAGTTQIDPSLHDSAQPALESDPVDGLRQVVVGTECESGRRLGFDGHDDDRNVR